MSILLVISPVAAALLVAICVAVLRKCGARIDKNVIVMLLTLFIVTAASLPTLLVPMGITSCSGCTESQAKEVLTWIKLPKKAESVNAYSSFWQELEFASFQISRTDYMKWCREQSMLKVQFEDLIQPLFEYDSSSNGLKDIDEHGIESLNYFFRTSNGYLQSAFDLDRSRALVWFIGR